MNRTWAAALRANASLACAAFALSCKPEAKITTCEVVVDFQGEPRTSPKRKVLGALENACRAVHPFF